jgi:hypothetical protein
MRELARPTIMPVTAQEVLKRFQKIVNRITGRFALAARAKPLKYKDNYKHQYIFI